MQCPKCLAQLPEHARFCGMCGFKFDQELTSPPVAEKFGVPLSSDGKPARFFEDATAQTDVVHSAKLKAISDEVLARPASVEISAPGPAVPDAAAIPQAALAAAALAGAPKPEKNVDPVTRQPFEFRPVDLSNALRKAALVAGQPPPGEEPGNLTSYYAVGQTLGMQRKVLEGALHEAALERMDGPRHPAPVRAPLTSEMESIQPSSKKYVLMGVGALGCAVAVAAVMSVGGSGSDGATRGDGGDGGVTAPVVLDAPAPITKPKRHMGELNSKLVGPAIEGVGVKARACHETARKANPKVAGRLLFDVELEEDGTFSKLEVKQDTVGDPKMVECVKKEVAAYGWPKPRGGFFAMEFPLGFEVAEPPKGAHKGHKH